MLFFLFLCFLLASSTLVVQSSDSSYSSSSSRYCRRNIGHVANNCDCSAYQQLSCKAPSGCGYNGEGGGHQSKTTYTNGEGATHSGGYSSTSSSSSSNGGSGKSYSTGESSGTSSYGSDSSSTNGGGGSRYSGRALATSSFGKGDGEVAVFDVSISNISHRDLCGSNWDTRCECCCGKTQYITTFVSFTTS